jgi:hypothetical protein
VNVLPRTGGSLGHASAAMTLDVYSGLFDGHWDEVEARLNDAAMTI